MIVRFGTFHDAVRFAAFKKAEGYFAEVLDENVGHLWGAATAGGFRVLMSEETASMLVNTPTPVANPPTIPNKAVSLLMLLGMIELRISLIVISVLIMLAIARYIISFLIFIIFSPATAILDAGILALFFLVLYAAFLQLNTYKLHDHPWRFLAQIFVALIAILLIIASFFLTPA